MDAVRATPASHEPQRARLRWRWVAATVAAMLMAVGVGEAWFRPGGEPVSWTRTLEHPRAMPGQASAAVFGPLSAELESLDRDVRSAADFLMASVP